MEEDNIKILKTRYAKGEISKKEYEEMKKELAVSNVQKGNIRVTEKKGGGGGIIGVIILIVIVLAVLYLLSTGALNSLVSGAVAHSGGLTNPTVVVSGYVKTSPLTSPSSITFGSSTVTVNNGYYTVSLQNDQYYAISVSYSSLTGTQSCNAGSLDLQASSSNYNYNVSC